MQGHGPDKTNSHKKHTIKPAVTVTDFTTRGFPIFDQGRTHSWKNLSAILVLAFCIPSVNFSGKEQSFVVNKNFNLYSPSPGWSAKLQGACVDFSI